MCPGKCTLNTFLLQKCSCPGGGGGCVSGKVHSEHILATKVLMPMGVCVGESVLRAHSRYQREVCNRYSNCLLVLEKADT